MGGGGGGGEEGRGREEQERREGSGERGRRGERERRERGEGDRGSEANGSLVVGFFSRLNPPGGAMAPSAVQRRQCHRLIQSRRTSTVCVLV